MKAWSIGTYNLTPGFLMLSKWELDSNPYTEKQSHVEVWIRLFHLPQEYWFPQTLLEIANGVGTPLLIDEATKKRDFGHCACILVVIDVY